MNFIRNNIVKIMVILIIAIVVVVVVLNLPKNNTISIEGATEYTELENKLQSAAIKYVGKNVYLLPRTTEKNTRVTAETLIRNKYLKELRAVDNRNVTCNGYVEIIKVSEKKKEYKYVPHIKCGNLYETKSIGEYIISSNEVIEENPNIITTEIIEKPTE